MRKALIILVCVSALFAVGDALWCFNAGSPLPDPAEVAQERQAIAQEREVAQKAAAEMIVQLQVQGLILHIRPNRVVVNGRMYALLDQGQRKALLKAVAFYHRNWGSEVVKAVNESGLELDSWPSPELGI